ncbi:MAG: ABC transporter ATP-binding protein [Planctomycetota bacterium]
MHFHLMDDDGAANEKHERKFSNREVFFRLLPFFREQWRTLAWAFVLLMVATACTVAGPQILRQVVNIAMQPGADESQIHALAGLFVVIVLAGLLIGWFVTLMVTRAGLVLVTRLKERLFRHVMAMNLRFFADYSPGRLLARVESDTESLKQLFSHAAVRLFATVLLFVGVIGVMAWQDPWTTLIVAAFVPVLFACTFFFLRVMRRLFRRSRRSYAEVSGFVTEYVQGVEVIQHYGYTPRAMAGLAARNRKRVRAEAVSSYASYGFWGFFGFFEILATAVVIGVGAQKVATGTMDIGTMVMFIEYLRQVFLPILMLSEFLNMVQQGFVAAERVFGILGMEAEETNGARSEPRPSGSGTAEPEPTAVLSPTAVAAVRGPDSPVPLPDGRGSDPNGNTNGNGKHPPVAFNHEIRFSNVTFAYNDDHDVLHDISFTLPRGQRIAVVGPSGGGKSTLANLLLSFYQPRLGSITVDGIDLRNYTRQEWRRMVGLVLQGVHLFPGSVRDNLTVFDPDVPDTAIARALEIVQAGPLVEQLGGLGGELAERGANLSHGERQLLSFARALVADPPLLVLDEATASVDPVTERRIQRSLDRMLRGRTAFIIAHRLATIVHADRILVVQGGRIVEQGTHDELHAANGAYRHLFDLQFTEAGGIS